MRYRLIIASRLKDTVKPWDCIKEFNDLTDKEIRDYNKQGYNVYYFPNYNSKELDHKFLNSKDIDTFEWLFVDMDLKDKVYKSKEEFLEVLSTFKLAPTKIIDSAHGIHAYWKVKDLTKENLCKIQKLLIKNLKTDKSIWTILQPMRLEGYFNTKYSDSEESCTILKKTKKEYKCDQFYKLLGEVSEEDKETVERHINKVLGKVTDHIVLTGNIPEKFIKILEKNDTLNDLYYNPVDRSAADFRIVNCMYLGGFTKEECMEVIQTTHKGLEKGYYYVESTVDSVFRNPPHEFDVGFDDMQQMFSEEYLLEEKKKEIYQFKVEEEHKKVKQLKEDQKHRGTYSIQNNKMWRKEHYKDSIDALKNSIKNRLYCITENLTNVVPLEGIELILVCAQTGSGKTTCSVNIVNPLIDQGKRVLYISTEERAEDVYSKVACLKRDWNYNNQRTWDEENWLELKKEVDSLVEEDKLVVVDNYTCGTDVASGNVVNPLDLTNLEDFKMLLNSVKRDGEHFDLVIVDYISKIGTNTKNDAEWLVIYKTVKFIEEWIKEAKVPAVVFSQLKNRSQEGESFQMRLPGSKRILNAVTCAIELDTDYTNSVSTWICHKNRKYGKLFTKTLKFDKGKYIDHEGESDTVEVDDE